MNKILVFVERLKHWIIGRRLGTERVCPTINARASLLPAQACPAPGNYWASSIETGI